MVLIVELFGFMSQISKGHAISRNLVSIIKYNVCYVKKYLNN